VEWGIKYPRTGGAMRRQDGADQRVDGVLEER
jgi:hypothetical protein